MKKLWLWYLLLTKRLLKKPSFLAVLLLAPLLALSLTLLAKEEAHIVKVAVYTEKSEDPLGEQITDELLELDGVIEYVPCDTENELRSKVAYAQADAGYLIPADLTKQLTNYVSGKKHSLPYHGHLISFITNEDTIQLKLAREQFYTVLYPHLSKIIAEQFTLEQPYFSRLEQGYVTKMLDGFYEEMHVDESIFRFSYKEGSYPLPLENNSYLTSPLRGLLALFVFLTGLSSSLYLLQDKKAGTFSWVRYDLKPLYDWIYILSGTVLGGLMAYAGLFLSGTFTNWQTELLLILLLIFAVSGFCSILSQTISNISVLGTCIPLLLLLSAALCPIFTSVPGLKPVKFMLPPYFYLYGLHSGHFRLYLFLYGIFTTLFCLLLHRISEKHYIKKMGTSVK